MEKGVKQDELEFIKQGLAILERQNKENELALIALAGAIQGIEDGEKYKESENRHRRCLESGRTKKGE